MRTNWLSLGHDTSFPLFLGPLPSLYLGLWNMHVRHPRSRWNTDAWKTYYPVAEYKTSLQLAYPLGFPLAQN